ncbi:transcription termination factor MTERF8, chloroplastic-like [Curcuma longa]|uniref:transcription termination factor MTERF8, chloroplastic-like n=1 Tax=Curcuma longa TaxID=136217 RepID=UPI003D9F03FD
MNRFHFFSLFSKTLAPNRSPRSRNAVRFAVFPYSSDAASAGTSTGQHMFMAQYLVESCGFDQNKATDASKLLGGIKSRQQPDSVLAFFKSYGFDDKSVKNILVFAPQCLLLDVEKSLAPKFRALQDLGLSQSDVVHLVQSNPIAIRDNMEAILSKIKFWQSLVGSEVVLRKFLKHNQWFLGYSIPKRVQPNLEILQECGITGQKLSSILRYHPGIVFQKPDSLKSLVSRVENLGVPRTSGMFHLTLWVLYMVNPNKFKMQMELFRGFGWSEDDFVAAFRKCPTFTTVSVKTLQRKMEFFLNEAGYASSDVMMRPILLAFSLEKRLIPRYQILTFLKSKGYIKSFGKLPTYMNYSEKTFLKMYILRYKDECPDLIDFYASLKKH